MNEWMNGWMEAGDHIRREKTVVFSGPTIHKNTLEKEKLVVK